MANRNIHRITIRTLSTMLEHLQDHTDIVPLVHGEPGIGKTNAFMQLAERRNMDFRVIQLNQMEPTGMRGLTFPVAETKQTVQFPPEFLPRDEDRPTLLLFDELGTCPPQIRAPATEMLLERRTGRFKLHPKHKLGAATNTGDDGTLVYDFDKQVSDRLCSIEAVADPQEWIEDFALPRDVDPRVTSFISNFTDEFVASGRKREEEDLVMPTPRSWARVSQVIRKVEDPMLYRSLIAGLVGNEVTERFLTYVNSMEGYVACQELLDMPENQRAARLPDTTGAIHALAMSVAAMAGNTDKENIERIADCYHIAGLVADHKPKAHSFSLSVELAQKNTKMLQDEPDRDHDEDHDHGDEDRPKRKTRALAEPARIEVGRDLNRFGKETGGQMVAMIITQLVNKHGTKDAARIMSKMINIPRTKRARGLEEFSAVLKEIEGGPKAMGKTAEEMFAETTAGIDEQPGESEDAGPAWHPARPIQESQES